MSNAFALFSVATLFGGMIFFAAVMAPLVFTKLPPEHAGRFIRHVFPVYYLFVAIASALAAASLALGRTTDAAIMAASALLTVWLRQGLMPMINRRSDAVQAGDRSAKKGFDAMHRLSVALNVAQIIATGAVLARFAL